MSCGSARSVSLLLVGCRLCPRRCGADRWRGRTGVCGVGARARVASYGPHHGEEDCLRGWAARAPSSSAAATWAASSARTGRSRRTRGGRRSDEVAAAELAEHDARTAGAGLPQHQLRHAEHVVPQILEALPSPQSGLRLPLVYNTSGYDSSRRCGCSTASSTSTCPTSSTGTGARPARDLKATDYPEAAREAVAEMHRQVGDLVVEPRRPRAARPAGATPRHARHARPEPRDLRLARRR